jgi:hypothetical protein
MFVSITFFLFKLNKNKKCSFKLKNLQCFITKVLCIIMLWWTWDHDILWWQCVTIITNSGAKFITVFFNDNTYIYIYINIIAIYKPPKMQVSHFNYIVKNIVQKMPSHCPTIIIGNFNVIFLTKTNQSSTLQAFMNKYNFKFTFIKNTTINDT